MRFNTLNSMMMGMCMCGMRMMMRAQKDCFGIQSGSESCTSFPGLFTFSERNPIQ